MLFDSLQFIAFFAVVFFSYYALPGRFRTWLLLAASCYFYMAFVPYYILILFYLIAIDYVLALHIEKSSGKTKRLYFLISLVSNIGTLFVFKYFNFFNENLAALATFLHWNYPIQALALILPLGLSFHIFQSLAYIIEVYRGRFPAERSVSTYALYVLFFPQLVAGPIERPQHLLPQLRMTHAFSYEKAVSGLRRMLWGFFKKLVIANWLAVSVDHIYSNLGTADGSIALVAIIAFSFQLYADFSGYSDIALGSAEMLGIELTQNFRQPYFSKSIAELWRRWHISLSSWFRDYVYTPLAWTGRSYGTAWLYGCIIITFSLTGLWHGAGWNYLLMGVLFGLYISIGEMTKQWRTALWKAVGLDRLPRVVAISQILITFSLASITWVFFRAENLSQAYLMLHSLFFAWGHNAFWFLRCQNYCANSIIGISKTELAVLVLAIAFLLAYEFSEQHAQNRMVARLQRVSPRWTLDYSVIAWILLAGYLVPKTFIYFQF